MLNDIARVFSSQGVLIQGTEAIPVSARQAGARPACDHKGPDCRCFGPKFEQAAAKLEISADGRAMQAASAGAKGADGKPLSEEERKQVRELEKRDREVKAHEAAHQASAGGQARGGANFDYQAGPDGKRYAVGGHVDIDVSPVEGNPRATLAKAMTAQRAALAPADPSGQDRAVAAAAAQMALQARKEMVEGKGSGGEEPAGDGPDGEASMGGKPVGEASEGETPAAPAAGGGKESGPEGPGNPDRAAPFRAYRRQMATGASLSVYA